jgi:hypothetical protein
MKGESDMTTETLKEVVTRYTDAAAAHYEATENGDHRQANPQHDIVAAAYRELRRRGSETVLLPLLEDPRPGVRSWAAAHALEFSPQEGERVLEELRTGPGLAGLNAQMTLDTWREGNLRFP